MKRLHFILILLFIICSCKKKNKSLVKITGKNIAIDGTIPSSKKIDSIVAPYKEKIIGEMAKVMSYAPKDFTKENIQMQSILGNLMADMCFEMANPIFNDKTKASIDFSMFNNGGLRASISEGNVTKENAFKLMPFENEFVVVELSGEKVIELINYFIEGKKAHPLSKNILLKIKKDDYSLKINGKKFDKSKTYSVLTSDYLQNGGDRMYFFKDPIKLTKLDYKIRDAIVDYFKKVDTLKTVIDKRVIIE